MLNALGEALGPLILLGATLALTLWLKRRRFARWLETQEGRETWARLASRENTVVARLFRHGPEGLTQEERHEIIDRWAALDHPVATAAFEHIAARSRNDELADPFLGFDVVVDSDVPRGQVRIGYPDGGGRVTLINVEEASDGR